MSRFYFNPAADRWAVAQIANLTSHQSYLALHLLGLVSSTKAEHRKLSLRRIAREQGHIDRFVVEVKAALVATRLLVEQKRNGGTSTYSLGPAVDGPDYQLLLEQHAQRTGTNKTKGGAVPQTAVGAVPQTAGVLSGRQQGAIPQTAHIESIESVHGEFLLKAAAEQPSAEVEPQASGLTASSPAEISEQPTAEQPEESTQENYATEWQQKKYQQLKEKQAQHELITVEPDHPVDSIVEYSDADELIPLDICIYSVTWEQPCPVVVINKNPGGSYCVSKDLDDHPALPPSDSRMNVDVDELIKVTEDSDVESLLQLCA
jgi:hypothetical protein